MANIQKQIVQYDEAIRLTRYGENATLVKKRNAVLNRLRDEFAEMRKNGREVPTFEWFNQGSYEMGTGINPTNGDYDIDVGLDFNTTKETYPDPVKLKELVHEALEDHTPLGTTIRRSCVTVNYQIDGEQAYHVDLAVYACANVEATPHTLYLAKGKQHSEAAHRFWESSDPKGLTTWVENRFENEAEKQFLRAVRILKGWKSYLFDHNGNGAPPGIGLTIAAGCWFQPGEREAPQPGQRPLEEIGLRCCGHPRLELALAGGEVFCERKSDGETTLSSTVSVEAYEVGIHEVLFHHASSTSPSSNFRKAARMPASAVRSVRTRFDSSRD